MTEGPDPGDGTKQQYKYDAWNRLVEVQDDQNATVATYAYDGLNRRIEKVDKTGMSDVTYHYYYNQDWQALEVRKDSATDPVEQYVWHLHYIDALAFRLWDKDEDGDFEDPNDVQYFTFDANFNVTALLNDSGTVKERYGYTPYGTLSVRDANFGSRSSSNFANPYTYTGRRYDDETGLYYYRNRYYHPLLGRFVSRDPSGYLGSRQNLYQYVTGRPTMALDPSGLKECCKCSIEGVTRKKRINRVVAMWVRARGRPDTIERGRRIVDLIDQLVHSMDELPDICKPPTGIALPGHVGEAGKELIDKIGDHLGELMRKEGALIWVNLTCEKCKLRRVGFFRPAYWMFSCQNLLCWEEMEPEWHMCTVRGSTIFGGIDVTNGKELADAMQRCVQEAWTKHKCGTSDRAQASPR